MLNLSTLVAPAVHHDANFVINGGSRDYHYDNYLCQCHHWRRSWHHNDTQFSGFEPKPYPQLMLMLLTHWFLGDLGAIIDSLRSNDNALKWMPRNITDDKSTLVQVMAWCRQARTSWLRHNVLTHCPSDALWQYRSGSTSAQLMPCCLTVWGHYSDQCWPIISCVFLHSTGSNFTSITHEFNP